MSDTVITKGLSHPTAVFVGDDLRYVLGHTGEFWTRTPEAFDWRREIERTLDFVVRLSMPVTSSECFVCGEAHKCSDEYGNVNAEEYHALYFMADTGRQTQEDLAQALYDTVQELRPEFEDSELAEMLKCARARFDVFGPEESEECAQYDDDELGEAVGDWLTYGIENALPDGYLILWDGDGGTVTVWNV